MRISTRAWAALAGGSVGWMTAYLGAMLVWWLGSWGLNFLGFDYQQSYSYLVRSVPFLSLHHALGLVGMCLAGYLVTALDPLRTGRLPLAVAAALCLFAWLIGTTPYPPQEPAWSRWLGVLMPLLGMPIGHVVFLRWGGRGAEGPVELAPSTLVYAASLRSRKSIFLVLANGLGFLVGLLVIAGYAYSCREAECASGTSRIVGAFLLLLLACAHALGACGALLAAYGRLSRSWVVPLLTVASGVALLEAATTGAGLFWFWQMLTQEQSVTPGGIALSLVFMFLPVAAIWNAVALAQCIVFDPQTSAPADTPL